MARLPIKISVKVPIEVQYRMGRYRSAEPAKIGLACCSGITQDAEFKRFNIWPEPLSLRAICLPHGDRAVATMMQKIRRGMRSN